MSASSDDDEFANVDRYEEEEGSGDDLEDHMGEYF